VTLHKVKYNDLSRFVAQNKGKVVLVDFWGTFCVPCRAAFPHVVALHQKYQKHGLVVVSVSVDDPGDEKTSEAVKKFLAQQKATMTNFLLDEAPEVWQKRLKSESVPLMFVFNRAGQIEKKYVEAPKPADLDGLVVRLLNQRGAP